MTLCELNNLILLNSMLTTPSQSDVGVVNLWQRLRRTPPMRDVYLRELKQIFFDNDFLWFQIWWEL